MDEIESYVDQDEAWGALEQGLAAYLCRMSDCEERDHLILELPEPADKEGSATYAQVAGFGNGSCLRAELTGDGYLAHGNQLSDAAAKRLREIGWLGNDASEPNWHVEADIDHAVAVAEMIVLGLRYAFGVVHPELLTHRVWGPAAEHAQLLPTSATDEVPVEPAPSFSLATMPGDADELVALVVGAIREKYGAEPTVDTDGDIVLSHLDQPVWVRTRRDLPAVEIFARVAHDVVSRRRTAIELALLNRDNIWSRWTLRDRTVWQTVAIPAAPFAPGHLDAMLDAFFGAMSATRDDLALRTGAKVG